MIDSHFLLYLSHFGILGSSSSSIYLSRVFGHFMGLDDLLHVHAPDVYSLRKQFIELEAPRNIYRIYSTPL